jgi:hypothetical protein
MSLQSNSNIINLLDDDDDLIPGPLHPGMKRPAVAAFKPPPMKKPKKPAKGFALIWINHNGPGQSRSWGEMDLDVMGIYSTKALAEEAKQEIVDEHEQCGYGDILVGDDEIDLIIREAPLVFEE